MAVNNAAGGGAPPTPLANLPLEAYDSAIAITLRSVFVSMKWEIAAMLEHDDGGAIVNMASTAGLEAVGGLAAYASAKHGVVGLTKTAALDYGDRNIRVNALAPGPILTDNLERAGEQVQHQAAKAMPMRRIGRPEEVARAVVWLCSDAASFISGTRLPIDGASSPGFRRSMSLGIGASSLEIGDDVRGESARVRSRRSTCPRAVVHRDGTSLIRRDGLVLRSPAPRPPRSAPSEGCVRTTAAATRGVLQPQPRPAFDAAVATGRDSTASAVLPPGPHRVRRLRPHSPGSGGSRARVHDAAEEPDHGQSDRGSRRSRDAGRGIRSMR